MPESHGKAVAAHLFVPLAFRVGFGNDAQDMADLMGDVVAVEIQLIEAFPRRQAFTSESGEK